MRFGARPATPFFAFAILYALEVIVVASGKSITSSVAKMKLLDGTARKVSIPLVILATIGWIVFLVGFALFNNDLDQSLPFLQELKGLTPADHSANIDYFPFWCFLITGAVLFINTIIHLIIGQWFTGVITHFLTAVYLVMGGSILYSCGLLLWQNFNDSFILSDSKADFITERAAGLYILVQWIGCAESVLFVTIYMLLWPLFTNTQRGEPESDVQVAPTPTHTKDPVTYRAPHTTGQTIVEQPPPEYPAGGSAWPEMEMKPLVS